MFGSFARPQLRPRTTDQKGIAQSEVDVVGLGRRSVQPSASKAPVGVASRKLSGDRSVEAVDIS